MMKDDDDKKKDDQSGSDDTNQNVKGPKFKTRDDYYDTLNDFVNDYKSIENFEGSQELKIIKKAKFHSRMTTIISVLAILLLLNPALTIVTYMYYSGKANQMLDTISKAAYVTEPNTKIEGQGISSKIGIFSMDAYFYTLKRVGKEDFRTAEYNIHFLGNHVSSVDRRNLLDKPVPEAFVSSESTGFLHPDASMTFDDFREREVLNGLASDTVAEVYISFDKDYTPEEINNYFPNLDVVWVAVETGQSGENAEGIYTSPLGYPFMKDSDPWSPFIGSKSNEETFISILKSLSKNEKLATQVSRAKALSISKGLTYIEKNGIKIYGAVVTGPVSEIRKIEDKPMIRTIKVEDSKLWNWHS